MVRVPLRSRFSVQNALGRTLSPTTRRFIATEPRWSAPNPKLPEPHNPIPLLFLSGALAIVTWTTFALYATNNEKLSSATIRNIFLHVRTSPRVLGFIGNNIEMVSFVWNIPRIKGELNMLQGIIDVSFDIKSNTTGEEGRMFFTAIRKEQLTSFQILRWRILRKSDSETLDLIDESQQIAL